MRSLATAVRRAQGRCLIVLLVGCAATSTQEGAGGSSGGPAGGAAEAAGGSSSGAQPDGGSWTQDGGSAPREGGAPSSDGGPGAPPPRAGNPSGSCKAGVPARGQPADSTSPTTVVGTGSPATCTFASLAAAVARGGIITFDCGPAPVSISVTATLNLPTDKSTVIDGGNRITLDGGGAVRILSFDSAGFQANENGLTIQHVSLVNGKATPTEAIPPAPAPCSQGWNDGEGGALFMRDGNLTIIDSIFANNEAALGGPDTGGGAVYLLGSKHGALIVSSTFTNNRASNGAAVGTLFAELDVYDTLLSENVATGSGANNDDASQCSVINNGQHEIGSGGNGGALYSDGQSVNVTLCGDSLVNNSAGAGAFGGGLFFTSNDMMGALTITDSTMAGNSGGHWTNDASGNVKDLGTAVGVNAKAITVVDSTLQGMP